MPRLTCTPVQLNLHVDPADINKVSRVTNGDNPRDIRTRKLWYVLQLSHEGLFGSKMMLTTMLIVNISMWCKHETNRR